MVLSNKPLESASAAQEYYSHGDYYGSEGEGIWYGEGARELGLVGKFNSKTDERFGNLLRGVLPTGQVLGRKSKEGIEHRPGIDFTFSCPKSFSIQMLLKANSHEKAKLETARTIAVEKTLKYIAEHGYVIARRKQNGTEKEKAGKLVFSLFNHTTNRNLEPQAHTHCFMGNVAKCSDGKYRSIEYKKILMNNNFIGQIFRNELAVEVKKLGYEIEAKILKDGSSSFELKCIHPKLVRAFSTRRQEIEELCEKYGIKTKEGRNAIVISSRKSKQTVRQEELLETWKTIENKVNKEIESEAAKKPEAYKKGTVINSEDAMEPLNKSASSRVDENHRAWSSNSEGRYQREIAGADKNQTIVNEVVSKFGDTKATKVHEKLDINEVYGALYGKLPNVLSEFGFVNRGNHYVSTTGHKVDGTSGKKGKVYVYANNPAVLVDYTRGSKSIWDYVKERHIPSASNKEKFEYLAVMSGLKSGYEAKTPTVIVKPAEKTIVEEPEVKQLVEAGTWEKVYQFALEKINITNNQVTKYLEQERGYSKEVIGRMGIGYIPSKKELADYLRKMEVSEEQTAEVKKALGYIGNTHKMIIPYHDRVGKIAGFAARDIRYNAESDLGKYMYTKGLARNSTLLGIQGMSPSKELIITEGMLDLLHAKAQGLENVIALGGTGFNQKQAELIKDAGIQRITLCLDNDKAGQEAGERVSSLIHESNPDAEIRVAKLPEGIKDLDELLKIKGIEGAQAVFAAAEVKYKAIQEQAIPPIDKETSLQSNDEHKEYGYRDEKANLPNDTSNVFTLQETLMLCIEDVTHKQTVFSEADLLKKVMKFNIGSFSSAEIHNEIKELKKEGILIGSKEEMTCKELLVKECQILKYAERGLGQAKQILKEKHFESRCSSFERREQAKNQNFQMNDQQKKALKHLLTSKDNVTAIEGLPGVGKSTILNAVRDISGKKVVNILGLSEEYRGAAPTASAAKTLQESAGIESATLHSFLGKYQGYIEDRGTKESLQALRADFKNCIIFLDESSLVPTRLMWKLLKLQDKLRFRLIMIGDTKQLGAVEAGNPFEQMLKVVSSVKLNKIVRQKDDLHKEAVVASSKGDIKRTFDIHEDNIRQDKKELVKNTVRLYMQKDSSERDKTLLLSPTRKLRDSINNKIRIELKKEGKLRGNIEEFIALRQKDMSLADYRSAICFRQGDILKFNAAYRNGIGKGDYLKVIETNKVTNSLVLRKGDKEFIYHLKKGVSHESKFEVFNEIKLKLQEGLKIKFTKNDREFGLINSETAILQKIGKETMTMKMENGVVKEMPKNRLQHMDYGYCVTVHSGQGKTFDNTIAAISTNRWLNNQKSWLVILSRHRNEFTALVEDKGKLISYLMNNKGTEKSAIELVSQIKVNQGKENILQPELNKGIIKRETQMQI